MWNATDVDFLILFLITCTRAQNVSVGSLNQTLNTSLSENEFDPSAPELLSQKDKNSTTDRPQWEIPSTIYLPSKQTRNRTSTTQLPPLEYRNSTTDRYPLKTKNPISDRPFELIETSTIDIFQKQDQATTTDRYLQENGNSISDHPLESIKTSTTDLFPKQDQATTTDRYPLKNKNPISDRHVENTETPMTELLAFQDQTTTTDRYLEENETSTIEFPPRKWREHWNDHKEQMSLVTADDFVALFTDESKNWTTSSFLESFKVLSDAWKYVLDTYGPYNDGLDQDPFLYILLHNMKPSGVCTSSNNKTYRDANFDNRHVIDCKFQKQEWSNFTQDTLMSQLGSMAIKISKGIGNWPAFNVCKWTMSSMVVFDIYKGLGREQSVDRRMNQFLKRDPHSKIWFRDWYHPIYQHANNKSSNVLNRFFSLLQDYWPSSQQNYKTQMNWGEFVHFWSGAAGKSLKNLAVAAFGWSAKNETELQRARIRYPNITYTKLNETNITTTREDRFQLLEEVDVGQLQIYFGFNTVTSLNWSFPFLSKCWNVLRTRYPNALQPLGPNLHIVFHEKTKTKRNCSYSPSLTVIKFTDLGFQNLVGVVQCGLNRDQSLDPWNKGSSTTIALFMNGFKSTIESQINFIQNEAEALQSLLNIFIYDLYKVVRPDGSEAERWLLKNVENVTISYTKKTYWFWDWYFKIYTKYGGAAVLDQFILISRVKRDRLHSNNNTGPQRIIKNEAKAMNVGEFVHLWSAAAQVNLRDLAIGLLDWTSETQKQFNEARIAFPKFNYTCPDCDKYPGNSSTNRSRVEADETNVLAIILGIFFSLTVVTLIAFGIKFIIYQKRMQNMTYIRRLTAEEINEFINGSTSISQDDANAPIHLAPFNSRYEIPMERLVVEENKVLGSGEFGLVLHGFIKSKSPGDEKHSEDADIEVAVKTVKADVEVCYFKALLSEIKIIAYLGSYENIVQLLGTVTANIKNREVFAALEFCAKGDLLKYLLQHRKNFLNLLSYKGDTSGCFFKNDENPQNAFACVYLNDGVFAEHDSNSCLSTLNLFSWSRQISNGMTFLSEKQVIHGDLAARNVLLTSNDVAKISDFGLSRQLVNYSTYKKKSTTPLPWRWMAIESIKEKTFSTYSDIWSFGVTLWEIFTLGKIPYAARVWDHEFEDNLFAGNRLSFPDFGNKEIYDLMLNCWKTEPTDRMSFPQIRSKLDDLMSTLSPLKKKKPAISTNIVS